MQKEYNEVLEILKDLESISEIDNGDLNKIRHVLLYQKELMVVYTNAVTNLVSEKIKLQERLDENN